MTSLINTDKTEQHRYVEYSNLIVNYTDGDVAIFNRVNDLATFYRQKPKANLIAMCTSGNVKMTINGQRLEVKENDVLFCPPKLTITGFEVSDDFECKVLCLSEHIVQGLLHDKIDIWNHAVYVNEINIITMSQICKEEVNYYCALLDSKIENHKPDTPYEIIQVLVRALLLELCIILENRHGKTDDSKLSQGKMIFNRFLKMLSNNEVKRQPISHYASQLAITPKYLTMLCLKYSKKTASDWIIQYTTEDIRFYLQNSNLSIKEISAKLGFANMSHFGSYVRKNLGMSPSDFRRVRNKS